MKKTFSGMLVGALALACVVGSSSKADAAFFAAICNDMSCVGGDDFIVGDNAAGDNIGTNGAISFATSAFGFNLLVNTSQSKPVIGSATAPQLDLTFTATSTAAGGTVYLYASDTDFVGAHSFLLTIGGTNSGGSGIVTGRAYGGTSNVGGISNLLGTVGPNSGPAFMGSLAGNLVPTVNPYALTIGVAINRTSAGTSTGDLNFSVPEPATMSLFGLGLMGFAAARRRKANQAK